MTKLIRADLKRCIKKVSLYIFLLLTIFVHLMNLIDIKPEDSLAYLGSIGDLVKNVSCVLFPLSVLIAVFGDELHSGAIPIAIGRGLSRGKVLLAKYFDCVIFMAAQFLICLGCILLFDSIAGIIASNEDNIRIVLNIILNGFFPACAYLAIAFFFIFVMWNAAVGFISVIFFAWVAGGVLYLIQSQFKIGVHDAWLQTLFSHSVTSFSMGDFDIGFIIAVICYIILPLFLTAIVFRRKELDL